MTWRTFSQRNFTMQSKRQARPNISTRLLPCKLASLRRSFLKEKLTFEPLGAQVVLKRTFSATNGNLWVYLCGWHFARSSRLAENYCLNYHKMGLLSLTPVTFVVFAKVHEYEDLRWGENHHNDDIVMSLVRAPWHQWYDEHFPQQRTWLILPFWAAITGLVSES